MKRILLILVVIAAVIAGFWFYFHKGAGSGSGGSDKPEAVHVMKHSKEFNDQVDKAIAAYMSLKDIFVETDSAKAKELAAGFDTAMGNIQMNALDQDSSFVKTAAVQSVAEIRKFAAQISTRTDIESMRRDFKDISDNMYPFLKTVGYEGQKLYWENCPMAFGDEAANWLSFSEKISNPYLGKHHPVYKGGMVNCGEVVDSIYVK